MSDYSYDKQIIAALTLFGALTTAEVAGRARRMFGHNSRTHSGFIRQRLLCLRAWGVVRTLDGEKPCVWALDKRDADTRQTRPEGA